jgi:AraC-like DNA-binding protein
MQKKGMFKISTTNQVFSNYINFEELINRNISTELEDLTIINIPDAQLFLIENIKSFKIEINCFVPTIICLNSIDYKLFNSKTIVDKNSTIIIKTTNLEIYARAKSDSSTLNISLINVTLENQIKIRYDIKEKISVNEFFIKDSNISNFYFQNFKENPIDTSQNKLEFHFNVLRYLSLIFSNEKKIKNEYEDIAELTKNFIVINWNKKIGYKQICKEINTNEFYLKYSFKKVYNTSIMAYQRKLRMEQAYKLLSMGELQIQEICELIGYSNPQHFSSIFKKTFGMLPKQVKKS